MNSLWLKGHKDRDKRKQQVLNYRNAFDDLKEILERDFKKKEAVRDYEPGWEYKQIATNEYNACLDEILKLINLKE